MRTVNKCCMGGKFLHNIHKIPCWKLVILFEIHYWIACFVRATDDESKYWDDKATFRCIDLVGLSWILFFLIFRIFVCLTDIKAKNHNADEKYLSEENWWIANFPVNDVGSWNGKINISQFHLDQWQHEYRKNELNGKAAGLEKFGMEFQ